MALGPDPMRARVRLALGAAAALDAIPRTVGVHTADGPDATIVELGGGDVAGMTRYLAGLGVPLEVLAPAELREAVRAYGDALAARNVPEPPSGGC
jgi:predicted DNA-binding transcriptional regulator YafY